MSKDGAAPHLLAAIVGAMMAFAGVSVPAAAQQTGNAEHSSNATSANRDQGNRAAARKPAKLVAGKRIGTSEKTNARDGAGDAWTLDDALLNPRSGAARPANDVPTPAKPLFGRIQLDTGTVGFETESMVKDNRFSDGRRVPGLEADKRNDPSYFGLSLSMPTHNNSILPVPFTTFWDRKE
jgi:hypothetical protein